jgi:hypothetical protein
MTCGSVGLRFRAFLLRLGLSVLLFGFGVAAQADTTRQIQSGDFTIEIGVRGYANLIYHLDCLAGVSSCTQPVFQELWRKNLGLTAEDEVRLEEWSKLRQQAQSGDSADVDQGMSPVPLMAEAGSSWTAVRHAGFLSSTRDALRRSWRPVLDEASVRGHLAIMDRFRPRFQKWWARNEIVATRMLPELEAGLEKARGPELLRQAAQFYGAELGERRVFVHLIVQPDLRSRQSSAAIVEGHMLVEVQAAENAVDRVPVIIHELAHHVWSRVPKSRKAVIVNDMLAAGLDGVAAWNLFDEVQATVIGNMLAGRNVEPPQRFQAMLAQPQSFYADDAIDRGARVTEALFREALMGGSVMDSRFVQAFVAALQRELRAVFDTPMLLLRNAAVNVDDPGSPWVGALVDGVRAWGFWTYNPLGAADFVSALDRFPAFSAAVFVKVDRLDQLEPAAGVLGVRPDELKRALGEAKGVAFITRRSALAIAVIVVVRDEAAMDQLVAAIPGCALSPGVCARVP